jgi:uncharacterized protein
MLTTEQLSFVIDELNTVLTSVYIEEGHNIDHAKQVMNHAFEALKCESESESEKAYTDEIKNIVLLAALLHDADDHKFFPTNTGNENAREIIRKLNAKFNLQIDEELVIKSIILVSASKNKNSNVEPGMEWILIPRWSDRLEAIGEIGVKRCLKYGEHVGNPITVDSTLPVYTDEDFEHVAPYQRFIDYNGNSASIIDHMYDKVIHIGLKPENTTNEYLLKVSKERQDYVKKYILDYWKANERK